MELSILLAGQIATLFLMMIVGCILVKAGLFKSEDSRILSNVVVYICSPCVIVNAFQIKISQEKIMGLLLAAAGVIIIHIVLIGGVRLLSRPLHLNAMEKASLIYSNAGNLIVPLVAAVLGQEWVFYTTAYLMIQTILMWTHGVGVIRQEAVRDYKKILLNPNMISIVVGLFLFSSGVRFPKPISDGIASFAVMIGPLSMMVIGMIIGNADIRWVLKQKRPYFICFLRLIAFPLIFMGIFILSGMNRMHKDAEYILLVVLLAGMAPAAATVTQLAQVFHKDAKYASVINLMSVIFCIITMPLMVFVYEYIIS